MLLAVVDKGTLKQHSYWEQMEKEAELFLKKYVFEGNAELAKL